LSGGVVGRRGRGVESLASTRCVIATPFLGQGAPEVHTSAPLHFCNATSRSPPAKAAPGIFSPDIPHTIRLTMPHVHPTCGGSLEITQQIQ
jgi:hypothetical protein